MIHFANNSNKSVIGVFLGGKILSVGKVQNGEIISVNTKTIDNQANEATILKELVNAISEVFDENITGIGIGVPSLVDVRKGIVYNVQNIPSWGEVHLKDIIENKFNVRVYVNNDANCFAVGEKYFGKAQNYEHIVGLIIGTGLGAGIITNGKLYSGENCGAGEYGSIEYKDHDYEHYLTDAYIHERYGIKSEMLIQRAEKKDKIALNIFADYGINLGNVIKTILYTADPQIIIIGGILSKAYPFFEKDMWKRIHTFRYKHAIANLRVECSDNPNIAVLGAAALCQDANNKILV